MPSSQPQPPSPPRQPSAGPVDKRMCSRPTGVIVAGVVAVSSSEASQSGQGDEARARELAAERKLADAAKAGDRTALAAILRKHGPVLYRSVLLPRLGSEAAAQDALADTYLRVVERFSQFEWRGCGVYPWLRVIALRIALDALRSKKRELLFDPSDLGREVDSAERELNEGLDAQLCEKQDLDNARARLDEALGSINERYATAIRLRVLQERSREDAAGALGVTVPTFDVVLHRALTALKKAIRKQEVAT